MFEELHAEIDTVISKQFYNEPNNELNHCVRDIVTELSDTRKHESQNNILIAIMVLF